MPRRSPLTILLSTGSYPYGQSREQTFLAREVEVLAEEFERVVLVPETVGGSRFPTPPRVEIDESLAKVLMATRRARLAAHAVSTPLMIEDVVRRPADVASREGAIRLVHFAGRAALARSWISGWLARQRAGAATCLAYTYWWGSTTTGFGLAKRRHRGLRVVTRAHGFDLYEDRHTPPYLPCRRTSLAVLDGLFPVSEHGRAHLVASYGQRLPHCETSRLGVVDPGGLTPASTDGVLRVVSCSFIRPIKRIDLLLRGLAQAGRSRPEQRFAWRHFGAGDSKGELDEQARSELPRNVVAEFPAHSAPAEVLNYYRTTPVDVFVNVSVSEGIPVSIMEAVAFGIPVLATAVGGNPEIATATNAILLSSNPEPEEIGRALCRFIDEPEHATRWREGSRSVWKSNYDTETNFRRFADRLRAVAAGQ